MVDIHDPLGAEACHVAIACGVATKEIVYGGKGCFPIFVAICQGIFVHLGNASSQAAFSIVYPLEDAQTCHVTPGWNAEFIWNKLL